MNITTLFHDVLAMDFSKGEYVNMPDGGNVMDYSWFLTDSDIYSNHINKGGVGVEGFDIYIIGRLDE